MSTAIPREELETAKPKGSSLKAILLSVAALVVLAIVAAVVVWFTPLFSVQKYDVTGNNHIPTEQVIEIAGVPEGEILAQVNVGEAATNVVSLPWVKSVTVQRGWPDALTVRITEHDAVAFSTEPDGTHLIDAEGYDFTIDTPPEEAVEITGAAKGDEAVRKSVVDIASSISEETRTHVRAIEARDAYNFTIVLNDDRTVVWGTNDDNRNKALALETVLDREGQHFDISNPSMVAVR